MDYNISYRKKDGSIQCIISYKDNNEKWRTKSKQGFKTQKDSKPWQKKIVKELEDKLELKSKLDDAYKEVTFKEFRKFLPDDLDGFKALGTIESYKYGLRRFSKLDNMELAEIGFLDIKDAVNNLIKQGFSNATINSSIDRLKSSFNIARDEYKIILESPLHGNKIILPEEIKENKVKALSKKELDILLPKMTPYRDYLIALIAANTGMRVGEIVGLTWNAIDFEERNIKVYQQWKKQKDGSFGFGRLKTKNSYRDIPIPENLYQELLKYKASCVRDMVNDRLFLINATNTISTIFSRKFKNLGFDNSIHDLRHTYATLLIASGMDFKSVASFLGDSVEMVIKKYAHFNTTMYEDGRNKIENIF